MRVPHPSSAWVGVKESTPASRKNTTTRLTLPQWQLAHPTNFHARSPTMRVPHPSSAWVGAKETAPPSQKEATTRAPPPVVLDPPHKLSCSLAHHEGAPSKLRLGGRERIRTAITEKYDNSSHPPAVAVGPPHTLSCSLTHHEGAPSKLRLGGRERNRTAITERSDNSSHPPAVVVGPPHKLSCSLTHHEGAPSKLRLGGRERIRTGNPGTNIMSPYFPSCAYGNTGNTGKYGDMIHIHHNERRCGTIAKAGCPTPSTHRSQLKYGEIREIRGHDTYSPF